MNISIGKTLAELRKEKKLMQKDIAKRLADYGYNVAVQSVHRWEKGISQPSIDQFIALCDIFDIDDVLWVFAKINKGKYAGLNKKGRQKAREYIELLFNVDSYVSRPEQTVKIPRLIRLYDIPVSAGTGNFLDDSSYKMIEAPDDVPEVADFALRVSGDSMEPLMQDGQLIWIKEQEVLENLDIGIFAYAGDVYCKKLIIDADRAYLRSLNPEYEDIEIIDDFGFKAIGVVIS